MTALDRYVRLESGGLWREEPDAQRRDVVISFGDATLVISDKAGRPLTHWSLPAVTRQNPGERPAIYTPDEDASEAVEIAEDTMIDAIEQVRKALAKARPQPGKLRHLMTVGLIAITLALAIFWLPGALTRQTLAVVPQPKRVEIGATILGHMQSETGPACREPRASDAAGRFAKRIFGSDTATQIIIVPQLPSGAVAIPGDLIVLDHNLLQGTDDPAVAAGYVLAAHADRVDMDPLEKVLDDAGLAVTFRLLTTGEIPTDILKANANAVATGPWVDRAAGKLGPLFAQAAIPSAPYAAVVDIQIPPDEAEGQSQAPILDDADWVSLQNICNA